MLVSIGQGRYNMVDDLLVKKFSRSIPQPAEEVNHFRHSHIVDLCTLETEFLTLESAKVHLPSYIYLGIGVTVYNKEKKMANSIFSTCLL
jgi:hypothetical protein